MRCTGNKSAAKELCYRGKPRGTKSVVPRLIFGSVRCRYGSVRQAPIRFKRLFSVRVCEKVTLIGFRYTVIRFRSYNRNANHPGSETSSRTEENGIFSTRLNILSILKCYE
ncbi:hypothetical protein CIPAW_10G137700 [Carya illinoinensis]|uniref:Uncharacterized protein n=1 Tax=Carya illinoinensis TaxID=32201 RepID=A0A8T1PE26_CARIL|nr:hypothetical protein CIPAW_10G137700 [Carya illinoinensis]